MNTIEPLQMYLLLFSNALFAAAACLSIVRFQRFYRRLQQFWDTPVGASLINQQEEEMKDGYLKQHPHLRQRHAYMSDKEKELYRINPSIAKRLKYTKNILFKLINKKNRI